MFYSKWKTFKIYKSVYNKRLGKLQSERPLKGEKQDFNYNSSKIDNLSHKRIKKINDFLHKASKYLVDFCVKHKIGTIVIGRNKEWKESIQLSKFTNQKFVYINTNVKE